MNSASFLPGCVHGVKTNKRSKSGIHMNEHLQRALIEIYYAMAELNQSQARTEHVEKLDDTRARLFIIKANLERLILLPGQPVAAKLSA
jgi:hypothetical protein